MALWNATQGDLRRNAASSTGSSNEVEPNRQCLRVALNLATCLRAHHHCPW